MTEPSSHEVTELLVAWSEGDGGALEKLIPLVHTELERLARGYMARERPGHTLQTTALINEAYLRLINWKNVRWQNRSHFFGVSARLMRRILVDLARRRPGFGSKEEGQTVSLEEAAMISQERSAELVALDDALNALEVLDPRKSQIVELRFFGGLDVDATAEVTKLSPRTVMREWTRAKAWLYRELSQKAPATGNQL